MHPAIKRRSRRLKRKLACLALALVLVCTLSGCMFKTVDEMYCLPKRSEEYNNLQAAINHVMGGLDYCAPGQGEHQQTVQLADLTGDGLAEAVLFAKGTDERPLKVFVFAKVDGSYTNIAKLEFAGTVFEQVEYADLDGVPGAELVVGRQMGNEVLHALSAYSFNGGVAETLLTAGYTRFLTTDLNRNGRKEIFLLRPGSEGGNGVAELYTYRDGTMERDTEATMSMPIDKLKRIATGGMYGDNQAVFVASVYNEETIITDVYAIIHDKFINVSLSNESGTSIKTIRNYYVYGDDIDGDGLIELPSLVQDEEVSWALSQNLIRWYNLTPSGGEVEKAFTFHNYSGRWYVQLDLEWMEAIQVTRGNELGSTSGYVFTVGGKELFTIYALTGDGRQTTAQSEGRFILNRTDEVTYAACLGSGADVFDLTQENLTQRFHFILEDWKTGET